MKLIETGKVVTTHGVKGEIRLEAWSDSLESLLTYKKFYLTDGKALPVEYTRVHRGCVNVKFEGIDSIDDALPLIHQVLCIDASETALPEGTFYVKDLIGCSVSDADTGETYGEITDVQPTGSNDVYHVHGETGRLYMIPAIKDVIISVDVASKTMRIRPLEGLMDL